jgi:hypothetical protein
MEKPNYDKLTLEDNFSVEKIETYIEEWHELSPSFQLVIVKWLTSELKYALFQLETEDI